MSPLPSNARLAFSETAHRPWPLPRSPWAMAQTWHDLLFAHWPLDPEQLRPLVPPALPLDRFDGAAWVGVVPFSMSGVRPRAMPALPWISAFPELNVRTYVTLGDKPGVYFFSLDAANRLAVATARRLFLLPYFHARMSARLAGDSVRYASDRIHQGAPAASLRMAYRPTGPAQNPRPGSLEQFLTERYCLYTTDARGRPFRCNIQHPPWPLQPAEAQIEQNTMAAASKIALPDRPPLLHFARRQDMVAWLLEPAGR